MSVKEVREVTNISNVLASIQHFPLSKFFFFFFLPANSNSQISLTTTLSPKIPQHATFIEVLTSDGGVCESWQSWEPLCLVWGSRRAESWGTQTGMQLRLPRSPTNSHTHTHSLTWLAAHSSLVTVGMMAHMQQSHDVTAAASLISRSHSAYSTLLLEPSQSVCMCID